MCQQCVTTEPSVYAEVDSDWTLNRAFLLLFLLPLLRLLVKNVAALMIHLRVAPVLKCRPLRRPR